MSLNDFVKTYIHNLSVFYCTNIDENKDLEAMIENLDNYIKELIKDV